MSSVLEIYKRRNISFTKGEGVYLFSTDGEKYLDFVAGIAVNSLGHCHPYVVEALKKQAEKLWHVSNAFVIPEQELLAKRLCDISFADYVMFVNSGAEATEASIKVARKYFFEIGKPEKNRIITFTGAFHGRTLAALFAANNKEHTLGFEPRVDGFDQVPFGDHEAIKKAINKKTAAILLETILGEGGIKVVPDYCLKPLRKLCDENEILLILDEVQCGIGRTGKFFAFEYSGIEPDIVPIAKGIGTGFPVGACLVNKKVAVGMKPGTHGSTFGGNPLAMAVANAVLDVILKKGFMEHVQEVGVYFEKGLKDIQKKYTNVIAEVRGIGLLRGIKLNVDNGKFLDHLFKHKMLGMKGGDNVVRLLPPLIVEKKHIDQALEAISKTCSEL
ncbi:MAG: aspartate aminotransferase family protein [Candidatus Fonsibacter sp.]|jgi:acetylornithine/N-succinyldiaminopimelate aminotransferase